MSKDDAAEFVRRNKNSAFYTIRQACDLIAQLQAEKTSLENDIIKFNDICVFRTRKLQKQVEGLTEMVVKAYFAEPEQIKERSIKCIQQALKEKANE